MRDPARKDALLNSAFEWASNQLWSRRVQEWHELLQSSNPEYQSKCSMMDELGCAEKHLDTFEVIQEMCQQL